MAFVLALIAFFVANASKLSGFLLPPVVELLNKDIPNENVRFMIALVVCVLDALLINWNQLSTGSLTQAQFLFDMNLVFIESQTIFKLYFQGSWLRQKIQTTVGSVNAPQLG